MHGNLFLEHGNYNKQTKNNKYFSSRTSMGVRKSSNLFSNPIKSPYLTSSKAVIQNLNTTTSSGVKPLTSNTPESPKIQNSKYFN